MAKAAGAVGDRDAADERARVILTAYGIDIQAGRSGIRITAPPCAPIDGTFDLVLDPVRRVALAGATEHGPYDGWTAIGANDRRILWRHTSGRVSLWTVDGTGAYQSHVEHQPAAGWTAIGYANDTLLLRHSSGRIALWTLDDAGNFLDVDEYGPYAGWTALSYGDGELIWRNADGRMSTWTLDRTGGALSWE